MIDFTHTLVKHPKISSRFLADYMAASEIRRRTIIRDCKYISTARRLQHDRAMPYMSSALLNGQLVDGGGGNISAALRNGPHTSPFQEKKAKVNADAIDHFDTVFEKIELGKHLRTPVTDAEPIELGGVIIKPMLAFGVSRFTKTNKLRIGAACIRYSKNKPVKNETAQFQAAFTHGYLRHFNEDEALEVEPKLCWLIDAFSGKLIEAPSNSVSIYNNITSACYSISERWDKITPPARSIIKK